MVTFILYYKMKRHHIFILLAIFFAGCSSNESLSSFGKRKYTKGYFNNMPAEKPGVVSKAGNNNKVDIKSDIVQAEPGQKLVINDSLKNTIALKKVVARTKSIEYITKAAGMAKPTNSVERFECKLQPVDDKPTDTKTPPKTTLSDIAFLMAMIVLAIFIVAVVLASQLGLELLLITAIAILPGIAGLVLGILALAKNNGHQALAIIALVICGLVVLVFR